MQQIPNSKWFRDHTIAFTQRGYGLFGGGLVAVVDKHEAGIIYYELDSMCPLEDAVELDHEKDRNYNWLWEGSTEELFNAAKNCTDLMFPDRKIIPEDSDYEEMMAIYTSIRHYIRKTARKKNKHKNFMTGNYGSLFDNTES